MPSSPRHLVRHGWRSGVLRIAASSLEKYRSLARVGLFAHRPEGDAKADLDSWLIAGRRKSTRAGSPARWIRPAPPRPSVRGATMSSRTGWFRTGDRCRPGKSVLGNNFRTREDSRDGGKRDAARRAVGRGRSDLPPPLTAGCLHLIVHHGPNSPYPAVAAARAVDLLPGASSSGVPARSGTTTA